MFQFCAYTFFLWLFEWNASWMKCQLDEVWKIDVKNIQRHFIDPWRSLCMISNGGSYWFGGCVASHMNNKKARLPIAYNGGVVAGVKIVDRYSINFNQIVDSFKITNFIWNHLHNEFCLFERRRLIVLEKTATQGFSLFSWAYCKTQYVRDKHSLWPN